MFLIFLKVSNDLIYSFNRQFFPHLKHYKQKGFYFFIFFSFFGTLLIKLFLKDVTFILRILSFALCHLKKKIFYILGDINT